MKTKFKIRKVYDTPRYLREQLTLFS